MALPNVTMTGNLTADPELKFTREGSALCSFRIACGERKKNQQTGEWEDGDTTFLNVTTWRSLAENVAESIQKGNTVTVVGRLKSRTVENAEGVKQTFYDIDATDVAVSLSRAVCVPKKSQSKQGKGTPDIDPWAAPVQDESMPF